MLTEFPELQCVLSTRRGGISKPPYATLNLAATSGDDPRHVAHNRRVFARAADFELERAARMHQVHGARVVPVTAPGFAGHADGLVTRAPDIALVVTVADCLPIFLADLRAGVVAAVHAGWRGLAGDIAGAAVDAMAALGADPGATEVAIGPSIGPCCFEVGPEVLARFPAVHHRAGPRRPHVDLWAVARGQLEATGIRPAAIRSPPACTCCRNDLFFSARRGEPTGRMAGIIIYRSSAELRARPG